MPTTIHLMDELNKLSRLVDTSNNIMEPKNKNSQTIEKVKRSTRMGQRPK